MASIKAISDGLRPSNGWRLFALDEEPTALELIEAVLGAGLRLSEGSAVDAALRCDMGRK